MALLHSMQISQSDAVPAAVKAACSIKQLLPPSL
jgi:hypothetical protein